MIALPYSKMAACNVFFRIAAAKDIVFDLEKLVVDRFCNKDKSNFPEICKHFNFRTLYSIVMAYLKQLR